MNKSMKIIYALNDIDDELIEISTKEREKRTSFMKIAMCSAVFMCISIIVVSVVYYYQNFSNLSLNKKEDMYIGVENDSIDNQKKGGIIKSDDYIFFNNSSILLNASIDGIFKDENITEEFDFIKRVKVPENYTINKQGKVFVRENASDLNYSKLLRCTVIYSDIDDKSKYTEIDFTTGNNIVRCIMPIEDDFKYSMVNGYSIKLFHTGIIYEAYFDYNGYNFYIESYNLAEEEFIELLKSLII